MGGIPASVTSPGQELWGPLTAEDDAACAWRMMQIRSTPDTKIRFLPWRTDTLTQETLGDLLKIRVFLKRFCATSNMDVDEHTKHVMALQTLATLVAYRNPDIFRDHFHSFTFDFPLEAGRIVNYRLDTVIDLGGGMKAFGFKAEGAPPLLLFHGTFSYPAAPGCLATVLADLEWAASGRSTYDRNQTKINEWLNEATQRETTKAVVSGHSLGGALGLYTGVHSSKYVQEATVFSPAGVDRATRTIWEIQDGEKRARLSSYNPNGDLIPRMVGEATVGDVYVGDHVNVPTGLRFALHRHINPHMLHEQGYLYKRLEDTNGYTTDIRFRVLIPVMTVLLAGLTCLIVFVIVPAVTTLVLAGTWPILLGAIAALCLVVAITRITYPQIQGEVEKAQAQKLAKQVSQYSNLITLQEALKSKEITPQEFAFNYLRHFHEPDDETPTRVVLLRAFAAAYKMGEDVTVKHFDDFFAKMREAFNQVNVRVVERAVKIAETRLRAQSQREIASAVL